MAFRGQIVTLPVGLQGFNGSKNPSKMGPGHFSYVEGVDIDGGVLVKEGGAMKLNAVALGAPSSILAGINWSPIGSVKNDVVFLADGTARKDSAGDGTFATTLRSGLNPPLFYPPTFSTGGGETVGNPRRLFMASDSNQLQVVNGTANTMAAISGPAADWVSNFPLFAVNHDLRMWAGGVTSEPHRLYYTGISDHQDFTTGGTLPIYPGEGEIIVAAISFRGLLIVYKRPKGVYVVDTRDPTPANWSVTRLNSAVGACGPLGICQISNDIIILDPGGNFHLMTAVQDFGDINTSNIGTISDIPTFMRRDVALTALHKACSAWYAAKSKAWFMVPQLGSTDNDMRIVIDFSDPQAGPRFLLSRRDTGVSIWMREGVAGVETPVLGDDAGFIRLMDEDERNKDGDAYPFSFDTSETDFSFADPVLAAKSKNGMFLEISADLINNTTLDVVPVWDGIPSDPIAFELGGGFATLGTFVLDTDVLASAGVLTKRQRLTGSGRRLKLMVDNETLDDEVRLSEIRVEFGIADERT